MRGHTRQIGMRSLSLPPARPLGSCEPVEFRHTSLVPSVRHWALLVAGLLTILSVVSLALPDMYWVLVVGPAQESQFGFRSQLSADGNCLTIVSVSPGGPFHRAGVKAGWASAQLSCFGFSQPHLLFETLRNAKRDGYPAHLRFRDVDPRHHTLGQWVLVHPDPPPS